MAPHRGSARRCLMNGSKTMDKTFLKAAAQNSIPASLIHPLLPLDLVLWIDPGSVAYRTGSDHSPILTIWEDQSVIQQRLLQQQHIKMKWSQGQLSQSPPTLNGYISPSSGYDSGNNSPQLSAQQFVGGAYVSLPQRSKVVMKMPGSMGSGPIYA
ncbi:hypothetical protein BDR26DRAFT_354091 [Obelidium mucronatum]|nr:hypothetical protein BDR26DRAFT_354091 [Obelidium mucronatum]